MSCLLPHEIPNMPLKMENAHVLNCLFRYLRYFTGFPFFDSRNKHSTAGREFPVQRIRSRSPAGARSDPQLHVRDRPRSRQSVREAEQGWDVDGPRPTTHRWGESCNSENF